MDKAANARRDSTQRNHLNTAVRAKRDKVAGKTRDGKMAARRKHGLGRAIGGAEQSINLGDRLEPAAEALAQRADAAARDKCRPHRGRCNTADARAAELVRKTAPSTKIKIKPGTTKPLAVSTANPRKKRHADGVLVLRRPAPLPERAVSPEHSCAPTEIIAPSSVSSLGSQSARKATPEAPPRPRRHGAGASTTLRFFRRCDDDEEVRRLEAARGRESKKRRRDAVAAGASLEMPSGHRASTPGVLYRHRAAPRPRCSRPRRRRRGAPRRQAAVEAAFGIRSDGEAGRRERRRAPPPARKREKHGKRVAGAAREADLLRAACRAGGALSPERRRAASFQTPPSAPRPSATTTRRRRDRTATARARLSGAAARTAVPATMAAIIDIVPCRRPRARRARPAFRGRDFVLVAQCNHLLVDTLTCRVLTFWKN